MTSQREQAYRQRMRRVLEHIDAHLDEPLDIARLSAVAAFSPFHFQRQFSALFGLSVGTYVRALRLKRAGSRLAFSQETVTAIALDSGYEGNEALARALRKWLKQSPSALRSAPDWEAWQAAIAPLNEVRREFMSQAFTFEQVEIRQFPETPVVILPHRGPPVRIGDSVRKLIDWRRANGLPPSRSATFNIFHDDPDEVLPEAFRLDLAVACSAQPGEGMERGVIPAGRCAVLRQVGSPDDLRAAFAFLYGEWWPQSGEEARDAPPFAQRVSFYPEVAEQEAVTDLFLPLR
jgi:AraC family transcriptional regulator